MTDKPDTRVRRVFVPQRRAADLFKESVHVVDGVPDDAECEGIYTDPDRGGVVFVIQSAEFGSVDEGDVIPEIDVELAERLLKEA